MKEYIDREKLIAEYDRVHVGPAGGARKLMVDAPTADVVEVRHGEWHYNPNGMDWGLGAWECSLCGCTNNNLPMDEKINPRVWAGAKYCPNCGAKMYGERKEQK